ncbi:MAG: hypothetical protein KME31_20360 [Tolypothrix carrinoi HA7290-LM1]|nr:hypothetical protein [Tolypothrix carrinoi HA7290-LM1]
MPIAQFPITHSQLPIPNSYTLFKIALKLVWIIAIALILPVEAKVTPIEKMIATNGLLKRLHSNNFTIRL